MPLTKVYGNVFNTLVNLFDYIQSCDITTACRTLSLSPSRMSCLRWRFQSETRSPLPITPSMEDRLIWADQCIDRSMFSLSLRWEFENERTSLYCHFKAKLSSSQQLTLPMLRLPFVQSTRMQRFSKTIQTLSCLYSLDSSH